MNLNEMFKDYVPEIGDTMYLVFKDEMKVEKRTVYHFKTIIGLINAIEYAEAEGADYAFFDLSTRTPVYSTKDGSCACVIDEFPRENILDFGYISTCIDNIVKNDKLLFTRYYFSLIKPQYLINKIDEHNRIMNERRKELEEAKKKREEELERWFKEG
jgi:hypothetical protein